MRSSYEYMTYPQVVQDFVRTLSVNAAFCFNPLAHHAFAAEISNPELKNMQSPNIKIGKMPTYHAETLSERKVTLPLDFPGNRTLLLVTFAQAQQKNMDTWVVGLGLLKSPMAWAVLPVIDKQNAFVQAIINSGMRMGTQDAAERDRTIPLFTSQEDFIAAMQIKSGLKINYAQVVDRLGTVWAIVAGDYSAEKAAPLLAALAATAESEGK